MVRDRADREKFIIRVSLQELTSKKAIFAYELVTKKERKPVASGYTVHIATDANAKVCPLPSDILEKLAQ
jgi:acyl-CoA thioesterase FadM